MSLRALPTYDFINDEFLTMRTATAGTTTLELMAITADKAEVIVTKPETYSRRIDPRYDYQIDEPTRVLIEGPIEVGHTLIVTDVSVKLLYRCAC